MDFQSYLQEIQPGLTLYGVLLTFGVLSLVAARFFWRYERELIHDNVDRLRSLMDGFRTRHIEPVLERQLLEVAEASYREGLEDLRDELAEASADEAVEKNGSQEALPADNPSYTISVALLDRRIEGPVHRKLPKGLEGFFTSATGEKFFESLDRLYNMKYGISEHYSAAKSSCALASYGLTTLGLLLLVGLVQVVISWPDYLLYPWLSVEAIGFILSAGFAARMEFHRRRLVQQWEDLQIYGRV